MTERRLADWEPWKIMAVGFAAGSAAMGAAVGLLWLLLK